jgi:hypothetical protein
MKEFIAKFKKLTLITSPKSGELYIGNPAKKFKY